MRRKSASSAGLPEGAGRLRAHHHQAPIRGLRAVAELPGRRRGRGQHLRLARQRQGGSLAAIGEALAENGKVIVTGCLGVEADRIRAAHPGVLAITGPHQYEAVVAEVHKAVPGPHDPCLDLVPPQGVKLTPPLRLCEDLRRLQQSLQLLHHPGTARAAPEPSPGRRDARGRAAGRRRRQGASRHLARHQRLRPRSRLCHEFLARRGARDAVLESGRGARLARRLGASPLCLSLSACRSCAAADGRWPRAALSRHPPPACEPEGLEGDAAAGASGEDLASHCALARDLPDLAIRSTFIVGFPGDTEEDFKLLLDWLAEAQLAHVGCFKYENVGGAAANALPGHLPEQVKQERYDRLMQHQQAISTQLLAARVGRPSRCWSMQWTRTAPSRARIGMRRKSTGKFI
jgi:ribosomal protein S12 methylthiotransferase